MRTIPPVRAASLCASWVAMTPWHNGMVSHILLVICVLMRVVLFKHRRPFVCSIDKPQLNRRHSLNLCSTLCVSTGRLQAENPEVKRHERYSPYLGIGFVNTRTDTHFMRYGTRVRVTCVHIQEKPAAILLGFYAEMQNTAHNFHFGANATPTTNKHNLP